MAYRTTGVTATGDLADGSAPPARQYSTLREWAYTQIREMIVSGTLPPGADIHEGQLCAALGISKSPLREALRQLSQEGLVYAASNKGCYVSPLTEDDIAEIYQLRGCIEVMAVRLACERRTSDDVAALRANVAAQAEARAGGNVREIAERDVDFHLSLARIAGNSRLLRVQRGLQTETLRLVMQQFRDWGAAAELDAVRKHGAVVDAIEARDADAAEAGIRAHIRRGEQFRRDAIARGRSPSGADAVATVDGDARPDRETSPAGPRESPR